MTCGLYCTSCHKIRSGLGEVENMEWDHSIIATFGEIFKNYCNRYMLFNNSYLQGTFVHSVEFTKYSSYEQTNFESSLAFVPELIRY